MELELLTSCHHGRCESVVAVKYEISCSLYMEGIWFVCGAFVSEWDRNPGYQGAFIVDILPFWTVCNLHVFLCLFDTFVHLFAIHGPPSVLPRAVLRRDFFFNVLYWGIVLHISLQIFNHYN
jgi:hypothetical protein